VHECGLPKIKNLKIVHNSKIRYHFANFPQRLAQRLFSRSVLIAAGILIGLALLAIASDPSLIPGWQAYFFKENATLMILVLFGLDWVTLFIHEMAHLIAARSLGVSCQLGISNRLWVLVAETDMTGIWSVPRQQRYLPFLAGPLLDAVSASILILIFFLIERQSLKVNPQIYQLTQALLLNYLLGLLWQCYFFVRTDFYYVIANAFRCKNLLKDTEVYLRNQIARFSHRIRPINQSHIPKSERRVIRWYAILWVSGRAAALGSLLFITLPVLWHYCLRLLAVLSAGYPANPQAFLDALLLLLLAVVPQSIGFCFWIRSIRTNQYSH
jgi:putative peptide zinc metalloprotease protein